jgi:uncharacterized membrane protein YfcA
MFSLSSVTVIVAGVLIGLLLGLTGGGGSILTVPLLVYVVGLEAKVAIATSLLVVGVASLAALVPHSRAGNVYWRTGLIFGLAGMAGAYSGGRVAQYLADTLLLLLFAAVMIASGLAMLRRRAVAPAEIEPGIRPVARSGLKIVSDGFVVGIVTGLVGAGGGFLVVPALALLGGLPMHAAVGTSLLVIAMKCFAGLAGYVAHVPIDATSAAIVGLFAIVGTLTGSRLARIVPGPQLRVGFGVFVLVVAAILIVIEGSALVARAFAIDQFTAGAALLGLGCVVVVPLLLRRLNGSTTAHPQH